MAAMYPALLIAGGGSQPLDPAHYNERRTRRQWNG